jgi:hypothetical protein
MLLDTAPNGADRVDVAMSIKISLLRSWSYVLVSQGIWITSRFSISRVPNYNESDLRSYLNV